MTWFAIFRTADGELLSTGTVVGDLPEGIESIEIDGPPSGQWNPSTHAFEPVTPTDDRRITRLAFRNRFTMPEKVAIELASIDNPQADAPTRQFAAMLRVWLRDVDNASAVDLAGEAATQGVAALEQYGIVGAGRAAEILGAEIQPGERADG